MAIKIKAPAFPESVADGEVALWHKAEGESVARDELMVEIETDKVVMEVVAPEDGVLIKFTPRSVRRLTASNCWPRSSQERSQRLRPTAQNRMHPPRNRGLMPLTRPRYWGLLPGNWLKSTNWTWPILLAVAKTGVLPKTMLCSI